MIRVFVPVLVLVPVLGALVCLAVGWPGCAVALMAIAFVTMMAWEAGGGDRPVRLPPQVLDPAVRAKVGDVVRPGRQGEEGVEAREGVQGPG
jgi:hypothetical protein